MPVYEKRRACILVKAYPQHSQKYEETVCVAAIAEDHAILRLYPIRFRHLKPEQRFTRFDWIECEMTRATEDPRPESFRVKEDTIRVIKRGDSMKPAEKVRIWKPSVVPSFAELEEQQKASGRSFGIVAPDEETLKFRYEPIGRAEVEDQATARSVYEQQSLLEDPLKPLPTPEYVFRYQFRSAGKPHTMQIHDWEVETTYHNYKRQYGAKALEKMTEYYQNVVSVRHPHFVLGNMHKRPWQFIIIGVLRTTADVDKADAQTGLF